MTDALLNTVDIMPTLLKLLNLDIPSSVEGSDLSSVITEESEEGAGAAFISAFPGREVVIKAFKKANMNNLEAGWRGIRTKNHAYVIHKGYAPGEQTIRLLYDLENDPYQMNPKEMTDPNNHLVSKDLNKKLFNWLGKLNDPFTVNFK